MLDTLTQVFCSENKKGYIDRSGVKGQIIGQQLWCMNHRDNMYVILNIKFRFRQFENETTQMMEMVFFTSLISDPILYHCDWSIHHHCCYNDDICLQGFYVTMVMVFVDVY